MRTTLDLDETVLAVARAIARDEGISIGAAVSQLARRGLRNDSTTGASGFPIFTVSADAVPITVDIVNDHRDDD
jgi:hypothetical protein